MTTLDDRPTRSLDAEALGRLIREVWVAWASEQPDAKPSWLLPWEDLDEGQQEVDARMGLALFEQGRKFAGCGCDDDCDHLPYDRLARSAEELGKRLDEMAEVMRDAIVNAHRSGAQAGMNRLIRYVRGIPEMRAGIEFPADATGAAR